MKNLNLKTGSAMVAFAIVAMVSLNACLKDNFELDKLTSPSWSPTAALPLVNARLGVYDIMANLDSSDLFVIDPQTGMVALVYEGQLFSFNAEEIVQLPDQTVSQSFGLNLPQITSLVGMGSVTVMNDTVFDFQPNAGVLVDSMKLKAGSFDVDISSDIPHSGTLEIRLPAARNGGTSFSATIPLNYTGTTVTSSNSYDMTNYSFDMTNNGTSSNKIPFEMELTLNNSGNPSSVTDLMNIDLNFNGLQFSKIFGDFGNQTVSIDRDSINIRIFSNAAEGHFQLVNPQINIDIENSFGFPVELNITTLESRNATTGTVQQILLNNFANPVDVNFPSFAQMGEVIETHLTIDNTNSNIVDLMEPTPKWVVHAIEANSNVGGAPPGGNFLLDNSELVVDTEVLLPMEGYAYNWGIQDTVEFTFTEDNQEEIESVTLRVNVENHFPVDVRFQLFLMDSTYTILDSLMVEAKDIIQSGVLDADGDVVSATTEITDISYSQDRVPNLYEAKHLLIRGEAQTKDGPQEKVVKIYDSYYMNFRLGMKINANIDL